MLFHDLVAPNTFVGTLKFVQLLWDMEVVARGFEVFKSVTTVSVEWDYEFTDPQLLDETFFASAAQHGVRRIELKPESGNAVPADTAAALSFGLAEPTACVDRYLLGVVCEIASDFLEQVKQKVDEIAEAGHMDFTFTLANVWSGIDSNGFEKYRKDEGRTWLMDDIENRVSVEVKQAENLVEIHLFPSS
ncbi:hypothetical protein AAVH_43469 [Aphelenchoides avenae]|nr:hypothetical protein AAVH_43469 [Aphelenchus avenae]